VIVSQYLQEAVSASDCYLILANITKKETDVDCCQLLLSAMTALGYPSTTS